jgi:hypothetical protein
MFSSAFVGATECGAITVPRLVAALTDSGVANFIRGSGDAPDGAGGCWAPGLENAGFGATIGGGSGFGGSAFWAATAGGCGGSQSGLLWTSIRAGSPGGAANCSRLKSSGAGSASSNRLAQSSSGVVIERTSSSG